MHAQPQQVTEDVHFHGIRDHAGRCLIPQRTLRRPDQVFHIFGRFAQVTTTPPTHLA